MTEMTTNDFEMELLEYDDSEWLSDNENENDDNRQKMIRLTFENEKCIGLVGQPISLNGVRDLPQQFREFVQQCQRRPPQGAALGATTSMIMDVRFEKVRVDYDQYDRRRSTKSAQEAMQVQEMILTVIQEHCQRIQSVYFDILDYDDGAILSDDDDDDEDNDEQEERQEPNHNQTETFIPRILALVGGHLKRLACPHLSITPELIPAIAAVSTSLSKLEEITLGEIWSLEQVQVVCDVLMRCQSTLKVVRLSKTTNGESLAILLDTICQLLMFKNGSRGQNEGDHERDSGHSLEHLKLRICYSIADQNIPTFEILPRLTKLIELHSPIKTNLSLIIFKLDHAEDPSWLNKFLKAVQEFPPKSICLGSTNHGVTRFLQMEASRRKSSSNNILGNHHGRGRRQLQLGNRFLGLGGERLLSDEAFFSQLLALLPQLNSTVTELRLHERFSDVTLWDAKQQKQVFTAMLQNMYLTQAEFLFNTSQRRGYSSYIEPTALEDLQVEDLQDDLDKILQRNQCCP